MRISAIVFAALACCVVSNFSAALAQAAPPACTAQFQYNCSSAISGGYTVITPLAATGETQIQGFNTANALVFNTTIPIPPVGSAATDTPTQNAVFQAEALVAVLPVPSCSAAGPPCLAPNPGGSLVITNSTTSSYVPQDTVVTQQVNQYSTTVKALVGGQTVFQQTYAAQFTDPAVKDAIAAADAILMADQATPGSPVQTSNSSGLQSSQSTYVLTSDTNSTGNPTVTSAATFGPATIVVGDHQEDLFTVLAGQADININTSTQYYAARNVVTTDTYLTAQTYTIQGSGGTAYSSCDINRDEVVNVLDVQDIVGQTSGSSPPGASDLNGDGVINVADTQFVINAALNLGCAAVSTGTSTTTSAALKYGALTAIDTAGNRYTIENDRIRKLASDGTESTVVVVGLEHPTGIAVDAAGNLYVTDSGGGRVFKLFAGTITTIGKRP